MQHPLLKIAAAVALACGAGFASATVLSFESLAEGPLPASYGGIDWSAGGWSVLRAEQPPYSAHSGSARLAAVWGATDAQTLMRFATPTVFEGAWFAGLGGATVTFELFSGQRLVARSATLDPSSVPSFLASGYAGAVDAVRVSSPFHASYVMDDLQFTAAVPEPSAYALFAFGVAALAATSRRSARRGAR